MNIAVITGGETGERDISLQSAEHIITNITFANTEQFIFPEDTQRFINHHTTFDLVIPVIHGRGGEDGELQALLKSLDVPFLFSDAATHSIAIDKRATKNELQSLLINSPKEIETFPLFVKPRFGGSSLASQYCESKEELDTLLQQNMSIEFLKEEPITGREFTVGVIDYKEGTVALPVVEIIPKAKFFDFNSKYDQEKLATEIFPAQIPSELSRELKQQALDIHNHLKAKHISRSDFIVTEDNDIYFLEINTIPGLTETSLIPKMLEVQNISLEELFKYWTYRLFIRC